ncbi:MAG: hypothetical protein KF883_11215 [Thermomicrobiales bacterium]|nr:hypothetical protein [Thermomicrobiales bacterium]
MSLLKRNKRHLGQPYWSEWPKQEERVIADGWRFSLKGSPRHYDDVKAIIESDPGAVVYFGEALTYERGAGVALWRVSARSFDWLTKLYSWWAEAERVEPVQFTFHLYMPSNLKYPALDLRESTPDAVERYIRQYAPTSEAEAVALARRN